MSDLLFLPFFSIFFGYTAKMSSALVILYFSYKFSPKKEIDIPLFVVTIGLSLTALSDLFRLAGEIALPVTDILAAISTVLLVFGIIITLSENYLEKITLKKRAVEVRRILEKLRELYMKRELSEDDLTHIRRDLMKELTEIEVKLKG